MSSLFLDHCYRYLTKTPAENLHLVTGIITDGAFVLNEMVHLPNVRRAFAGASAGPAETGKGLLLMQEYGLRCTALFHSHPGRGAQSTVPSGTDLRNQRTWEKAYPLIGAVFSQDGYVRFFASSGRPKVYVLGRKVSKIDENLYKIEVGLDQGIQVPGPSQA
jgi:proteasome lid subunit RPN8/RPN11